MEIKVVDTSYQCNNMIKQTISHCQNCSVSVSVGLDRTSLLAYIQNNRIQTQTLASVSFWICAWELSFRQKQLDMELKHCVSFRQQSEIPENLTAYFSAKLPITICTVHARQQCVDIPQIFWLWFYTKH